MFLGVGTLIRAGWIIVVMVMTFICAIQSMIAATPRVWRFSASLAVVVPFRDGIVLAGDKKSGIPKDVIMKGNGALPRQKIFLLDNCTAGAMTGDTREGIAVGQADGKDIVEITLDYQELFCGAYREAYKKTQNVAQAFAESAKQVQLARSKWLTEHPVIENATLDKDEPAMSVLLVSNGKESPQLRILLWQLDRQNELGEPSIKEIPYGQMVAGAIGVTRIFKSIQGTPCVGLEPTLRIFNPSCGIPREAISKKQAIVGAAKLIALTSRQEPGKVGSTMDVLMLSRRAGWKWQHRDVDAKSVE